MPWTDRQQALLQAMGLRVWAEPEHQPAPAVEAEAPPLPTAPQAAPASAPRSAPVRPLARPPALAPVTQTPAPSLAPAVAVHTATRADLASLDWPGLRSAVAGCQACGLCSSRTQTVFGVGHTQARWMVVGEAPGENEDLQGEPFVGAAGQLLDRMLAALQLSRAADGPPERSVYIANTLKCRPPRNRNPSAEELAQCEPFLVRQIELLQPRIILAMGRFAVQTLLRSDEPIGRLRGRVHHYQGVPLVVTYHPAYLLRSLPEKAKAWEDLCLAAETAEASAA
ncbi:DNA polymerase [beta proteobacterium AAP121]|nr:DNA polymerase [beta proteobacterium AAP65]KPF96340.1 DNA polymerase [beta proteobacterium AAP121]